VIIMSSIELFKTSLQGGWPALSKFVYYSCHRDQYGKIFSCLSIGSRIGSILVSIIVGTALTNLDWQGAVRIVACITISGLPLLWISDTLRPLPDIEKTRALSNSKTLRRVNSRSFVSRFCDKTCRYCSWWCDRNFAFSLLSFGLLGLMASFELFLPLFLKHTVNPPSSATAFMTAVLPLGVATSIVFGSAVLEFLPKTVRDAGVLLMLFLLFLCTVCIVFFTVSTIGGGFSGKLPNSIFSISCVPEPPFQMP